MASRDSGISRLFVRPRATLLALVLTSVTLVTVSYKSQGSGISVGFQRALRSFTNPIRSTTNSVIHPIENVVSGAFNYSALENQNIKLKDEIATLKNQGVLASQYKREAESLTRLANIPFAQGLSSVTAVVDNYSPSNTQMTVDLDKGSTQGIKVGQPVVSSLGLVGRVVFVSSTSSTVLLISDPSSSVGVQFGSSGSVALAVGSGSYNVLRAELIDPGTPLVLGEPMFTSGLQGGIYPANIPVGIVSKFSTPLGALQENVTLAPMANLSHLQYVKVLDWLPAGGG